MRRCRGVGDRHIELQTVHLCVDQNAERYGRIKELARRGIEITRGLSGGETESDLVGIEVCRRKISRNNFAGLVVVTEGADLERKVRGGVDGEVHAGLASSDRPDTRRGIGWIEIGRASCRERV